MPSICDFYLFFATFIATQKCYYQLFDIIKKYATIILFFIMEHIFQFIYFASIIATSPRDTAKVI